MHTKKNICENLIGTLLKIVGKTKDTINPRVYLEEMGVVMQNSRSSICTFKNGTKVVL
jgi:hypothetical protein